MNRALNRAFQRCRAATFGAVVAALFCAAALAQTFPTRPLRIVVPLAPGGGNDTAARIVGHRLSAALGQQVVVDNRPGGGSVIASEIVAKSPPDGHTLYLVSTSFTVAPILHRVLPFDTLRDFAPISRVAVAPAALIVHPSVPVNSVRDVIALARAQPGQITFSSSGLGGGSHLGGELFNMLANVRMLHVPYRGSALATAAVLSGETAIAFTNPISSLPHIQSGRVKMIAVTTAQRWPLLPGIPTIAESGVPGYELLLWNGLVVPAATPPAVITLLHRELTQLLNAPEVVKVLASDGARPHFEAPQAFAAFLKDEIAKWTKVVRRAGITAN